MPFVGGTSRNTDDLDQRFRGGTQQCQGRQKDHGQHQPEVPGHSQRTHRHDNGGSDQNREDKIRNSHYYSCASKGHL